MLRLPARPRRARWLALAFGAALLAWTSLEDNHVWPVALLGWGLSALLVGWRVWGSVGGQRLPLRAAAPGAALVGAITGLGACLAAVGLMLFKNALHAHIFLDYPPGLMLATLERAPAWAAAGGLAGLGLVLIWRAFDRQPSV